MPKIVGLFALLALGAAAQEPNVNPPVQFPAWVLFCPGTETEIVAGCRYIKLDPAVFKFNPDHSLSLASIRQYGVKLTWSGSGVTGLPPGAANVVMVANGIRVFADDCWSQDQTGLVTFENVCTASLFGIVMLIDSTWDVRADFDPPVLSVPPNK